VHTAKQTATSFALIVESAYNERSHSLDLSAKFSSPSVPDIVWHKGEAGVENLSLAKNGLTALPAQIEAFGRLRRLDLGDNKLTALPLELGKCVLLEELILQKNSLTEIPAVVFELTRLTELDIRYHYYHSQRPLLGLAERGPDLSRVGQLQPDHCPAARHRTTGLPHNPTRKAELHPSPPLWYVTPAV
jgi:hypothetical protein